MKVEIQKGGKLVYKKSDGDEDVSARSPYFLNENCEIQTGATLRDIFLLIRQNMEFYKIYLNRWVEEIVASGLDNPPQDNLGLDYLELYWAFNVDDEEGTVWGNTFPSFHAIKDDQITVHGERSLEQWSVSLSSAYEFIDLPIVLNPILYIWDDSGTIHYTKDDYILLKIKNPDYSFGQILHGIIWELSFYGGTKNKEKVKMQLKGELDNVA